MVFLIFFVLIFLNAIFFLDLTRQVFLVELHSIVNEPKPLALEDWDDPSLYM